jgi:hypothetical protein
MFLIVIPVVVKLYRRLHARHVQGVAAGQHA